MRPISLHKIAFSYDKKQKMGPGRKGAMTPDPRYLKSGGPKVQGIRSLGPRMPGAFLGPKILRGSICLKYREPGYISFQCGHFGWIAVHPRLSLILSIISLFHSS